MSCNPAACQNRAHATTRRKNREDSTTGTLTHLLDLTPETIPWSDPALAAGKIWTDPYANVSIRVVSVDATYNGLSGTSNPANFTVQ